MKEIELKCTCGGKPSKMRLPNGKWQVRCKCGKKTYPHGRKGEATKEWNAKYAPKAAKAPAPSPAPKAEKKPAAKPSSMSAAADPRGVKIAEMLAALRSAAMSLVEAIDTIGKWTVGAFGVRAEDVLLSLDKGEKNNVKAMTVEVSPAVAKRLLECLRKAASGAMP